MTILTYNGKPDGGTGTWQILLVPSRIVKKVGKVSRL